MIRRPGAAIPSESRTFIPKKDEKDLKTRTFPFPAAEEFRNMQKKGVLPCRKVLSSVGLKLSL